MFVSCYQYFEVLRLIEVFYNAENKHFPYIQVFKVLFGNINIVLDALRHMEFRKLTTVV